MNLIVLKSADKELNKLDIDIQHNIKQSLNMFTLGGKKKSVKKLVTVFGNFYEMFITAGPGYRVYFRVTCGTLQVLKIGNKQTQKRDIKQVAKCIWEVV